MKKETTQSGTTFTIGDAAGGDLILSDEGSPNVPFPVMIGIKNDAGTHWIALSYQGLKDLITAALGLL